MCSKTICWITWSRCANWHWDSESLASRQIIRTCDDHWSVCQHWSTKCLDRLPVGVLTMMESIRYVFEIHYGALKRAKGHKAPAVSCL